VSVVGGDIKKGRCGDKYIELAAVEVCHHSYAAIDSLPR
jgi:hypothetical protein